MLLKTPRFKVLVYRRLTPSTFPTVLCLVEGRVEEKRRGWSHPPPSLPQCRNSSLHPNSCANGLASFPMIQLEELFALVSPAHRKMGEGKQVGQLSKVLLL